jgi:putative Mg2+ transporter-C (MgtC) family protein
MDKSGVKRSGAVVEVTVSTGAFYQDCIIRIAISLICGFLLGLERKSRQHSVGMRTLILISVSCTLLSLVSVYFTEGTGLPGGDPTRIIAGVVTGIGFLGGGAILRQGLNVRGLTSAAIIWTAAALGLAIGAGFLIPSVIVLVVSLLSLILLEKVEWRFFPAEKTKILTLVYRGQHVDFTNIKKIIEEHGIVIRDMNMSRSVENDSIVLQYSVKASSELDLLTMSRNLEKEGQFISFTVTD